MNGDLTFLLPSLCLLLCSGLATAPGVRAAFSGTEGPRGGGGAERPCVGGGVVPVTVPCHMETLGGSGRAFVTASWGALGSGPPLRSAALRGRPHHVGRLHAGPGHGPGIPLRSSSRRGHQRQAVPGDSERARCPAQARRVALWRQTLLARRDHQGSENAESAACTGRLLGRNGEKGKRRSARRPLSSGHHSRQKEPHPHSACDTNQELKSV